MLECFILFCIFVISKVRLVVLSIIYYVVLLRLECVSLNES